MTGVVISYYVTIFGWVESSIRPLKLSWTDGQTVSIKLEKVSVCSGGHLQQQEIYSTVGEAFQQYREHLPNHFNNGGNPTNYKVLCSNDLR